METRTEAKVKKEKEMQESGRREEIGAEAGREETGVRRGEDTVIEEVVVQAVVEAVAAAAAVAVTQVEAAAEIEASRVAKKMIIIAEKTVPGFHISSSGLRKSQVRAVPCLRGSRSQEMIISADMPVSQHAGLHQTVAAAAAAGGRRRSTSSQ